MCCWCHRASHGLQHHISHLASTPFKWLARGPLASHTHYTHPLSLPPAVAQLITANLPPRIPSIIFSFEFSRGPSVTPVQSRMTPYTAVFTPVPYRLRIFRPLYGYGYGGTRNCIGTVRIRPYTVYGTVLSPSGGHVLVVDCNALQNLVCGASPPS